MFKVRIATDNDVFNPDPEPEIARILRQLADRIERGSFAGGIADLNGNQIGTFAISGMPGYGRFNPRVTK